MLCAGVERGERRAHRGSLWPGGRRLGPVPRHRQQEQEGGGDQSQAGLHPPPFICNLCSSPEVDQLPSDRGEGPRGEGVGGVLRHPEPGLQLLHQGDGARVGRLQVSPVLACTTNACTNISPRLHLYLACTSPAPLCTSTAPRLHLLQPPPSPRWKGGWAPTNDSVGRPGECLCPAYDEESCVKDQDGAPRACHFYKWDQLHHTTSTTPPAPRHHTTTSPPPPATPIPASPRASARPSASTTCWPTCSPRGARRTSGIVSSGSLVVLPYYPNVTLSLPVLLSSNLPSCPNLSSSLKIQYGAAGARGHLPRGIYGDAYVGKQNPVGYTSVLTSPPFGFSLPLFFVSFFHLLPWSLSLA